MPLQVCPLTQANQPPASFPRANTHLSPSGRVTLDSVRLVDDIIDDTASPRTPTAARPPRLRASGTTAAPALAPEEALFRPESAPDRYAEQDVYMAHERDAPVLPDSDMLKAVHLYASSYYDALRRGPGARTARTRARVDENSMDETALLAFGILLEEAGRDVLGRRGHLVFTEAQEDENDNTLPEGDDGDDDAATAGTDDAQARGRRTSETPRARRPSGSSPSSRRRKKQKLVDADMD